MENQLTSAILLEKNIIEVTYLSDDINLVDFYLTSDDQNVPLDVVSVTNTNQIYRILLTSDIKFELGHVYKLKTSEDEETYLRLDKYVATKEFDDLYATDEELGIIYSKKETTFKFWSPLSEKVNLKLEESENNFSLRPMERGDRGVFSITVKGDLFNKKYNFVISQNGIQKEITDPYGKAVDANSVHSVVIDINDVKGLGTVKPETEIRKQADAIIYELHIRDFTEGDKSITDPGTYLAILEKVDYLKKLGVTHVQLLPVIDFDDVDDFEKERYNWGYNPISFFALEGSYSRYPEDALARLVEFKTLVNELHKNDIRVVMDVVYNHLFDYITTVFQKNVPYYYFRRNGKKMANASGCGDDVASERKMVRRIILDSVRYFLEVFDIDGYRFDLLGLIDLETSKEIVRIRDEVKPEALLYGEGWNMGIELRADQKTSIDNAHKIPKMGFFNDKFREVIKGSTFEHLSPGYVLGNTNNHFEIDDCLVGTLMSRRFETFDQSINYVECHDNQTLFDKLSYFDESLEITLKRVKIANAITILSLGVPLIHMGQEIGLSKQLLDNTYNIPHINNMDWKLAEQRRDMVKYLADLITLRKTLRLSAPRKLKDVEGYMEIEHLEKGIMKVNLRYPDKIEGKYGDIVVLFNPTEENVSVELNDYYQLYFSSIGFEKKPMIMKNFMIPKLSMEVLVK